MRLVFIRGYFVWILFVRIRGENTARKISRGSTRINADLKNGSRQSVGLKTFARPRIPFLFVVISCSFYS